MGDVIVFTYQPDVSDSIYLSLSEATMSKELDPERPYRRRKRMVEDMLRRVAMRDDMLLLKQGVTAQMNKFAKGDQAAAIWVRDTLDGRPRQRVDVEDGEGNVLNSLKIMFISVLEGQHLEGRQVGEGHDDQAELTRVPRVFHVEQKLVEPETVQLPRSPSDPSDPSPSDPSPSDPPGGAGSER